MTEKMPYFTHTRGLLFLHAEKEILSLSTTWIRPADTAALKGNCCLFSVCGGRKWLFLWKFKTRVTVSGGWEGWSRREDRRWLVDDYVVRAKSKFSCSVVQ